jgi:alpha-tubulin suppressor-like RCC1 family protein
MTLNAANVAAGSTHACAVKSDGSMLCWGINGSGATGDGTTEGNACLSLTQQCRTTPVVAKITDVAEVSPGDHSTCVRKKDGTLWCFGTNGYAELGDGTIGGPDCSGRCRTAPAQVAIGAVISVSVAQQHACAVKSDGTVWCWGVNGDAQLGDGTTAGQPCGGLVCKPTPVQVVGITNAVEVSSGYTHSCARKNDGTVWCWGDNNDGALGDGTMGGAPRSTPVQATITDVAQVGVGDSFTCARKNDGTVWCWGDSQYGEVGTGATMDLAVPTHVTALSAIARISAGRSHACAVKVDGTAWCWGQDLSGQLGNGETKPAGCGGTCEELPVQVKGLGTNAAGISAGSDFSCARKTDGTIVCWGNRSTGELGIGKFHSNTTYCGNAVCEPAPVPVCL